MPSAHRPARGERDPQLRLRKLRQLRIGILGGAEVAYSSTNARLPGIAGASEPAIDDQALTHECRTGWDAGSAP